MEQRAWQQQRACACGLALVSHKHLQQIALHGRSAHCLCVHGVNKSSCAPIRHSPLGCMLVTEPGGADVRSSQCPACGAGFDLNPYVCRPLPPPSLRCGMACRTEVALLQNEIANIFRDDLAALGDDADGGGSGGRKDVLVTGAPKTQNSEP